MKHFFRFFLLPTELPEKLPNLTAQKKTDTMGIRLSPIILSITS